MTDPSSTGSSVEIQGGPPAERRGSGRIDFATFWDRWGIIAVLLLLFLLMALIAPNFLSVSHGFNSARAASMNAGLAAGQIGRASCRERVWGARGAAVEEE